MRVPVAALTLRWAAEIMADRAIESGDVGLASETLEILAALRGAMEPEGDAALVRDRLLELGSVARTL